MKEYQFNKVCVNVINFLTNEISALYYTSIKDRLYCEESDSINRRCVQYVLHKIFHVITKAIAPVVPHLAEEMNMYLPNKRYESFFQENFTVGAWENNDMGSFVENKLLKIKKVVNKAVGASTLDSAVEILVLPSVLEVIKNK